MATIGYVAVDRDGLPISSGKRGTKLYTTASKARAAIRTVYRLRPRAMRAAKVFAVEAKRHISNSDVVIGFCLIGADGRPVSSGPRRTRLYTALGFARRAAKTFGGDVRYVVITA